ncbi:uncharacterized protein LOC117505344 isoform X2 [Thalassophryne amazonica]|uniref:uncharacterized protein LOC117505344 isoform X2 n=1 Tax=Thalassophryne amazonica TaxID=390379 RepID=UPI001471C930|nr:uncharacterized protein LOC117505344 isoform X2 [Thalassophryne amazonica]
MMIENNSLVCCVWTLTVLMITVMLSPAEGEAPLAVNVTQDVYEAEENSNVTLTWFFTVSRDTQPQDLVVDILRHEPERGVYLFVRGEERSQYVDQLDRGRFSCNNELFKTGRIKCIFRNVTVSDSGLYRCVVVINRKSANKLCLLNVTANHHPAQDQPEPETPVRERIWLIIVFVFVLSVCLLLFICFIYTSKSQQSFLILPVHRIRRLHEQTTLPSLDGAAPQTEINKIESGIRKTTNTEYLSELSNKKNRCNIKMIADH